MSINKKLLIFVVVLVALPMLLLLIFSNLFLNRQIEKGAQNYLENTLKIARNSMFYRLEEVKKGCEIFAESAEMQKNLERGNIGNLYYELQQVKSAYRYLDLVMVLDAQGKNLASLPSIKEQGPEVLQGMLEKVKVSKEGLSSEIIFPLDDLFDSDSAQYNQYKVKLDKARSGENWVAGECFTKCFAGVIVTPIYKDNHKEEIAGFLIAADIANNDDYFPKTYSKSVQGSYLAISVDGIRVTSNICSPKKENYIGSSIPISMKTLDGVKKSFFGYVNLDDEIHVFLDEPILDYEGQVVGVLGVGIPKERFFALSAINRNLIFAVAFLCLGIMLVIGRQVALRITEPIIQATKFAESIVAGEREVTIDEKYLRDNKTETTILLKTFRQMVTDLKVSEEERKRFWDDLKNMNAVLEKKVEARTQDLRQAIIALKKADVVKSQFLANMSHELRTPLNAIICSSEVLADELFGSLNEKQERYVQNILTNGVNLLQLINDILDLSKIEAGKTELFLSEFHISDIVANSFSVVKSLAYRKNIEVFTEIIPQDFRIKADAIKLKQILYNLLSNAIKFTPEGGKIEVKVYQRGEFMQVVVRDNGIGIKEEEQGKIFCAFEQVDDPYEKQYPGTGLGLPLTKNLVNMHGGEIYLNSKFGQGTEVIFAIPIDTEEFLGKGLI